MALSFQKNGRGIKVFNGTTHMKTIPKKLLKPFKEHHGQISFDKKKRLTADERKLLHGYILYANYIEKFNTVAFKHIYLTVKDHYPVSARKVINHESKPRFELVLNNGIKIVCPEKIYKAFATSEEIVYSNF